jgi:hypothetical protein
MTIQEVISLGQILKLDVDMAADYVNSSDENFAFKTRVYIRAVASWIEGNIWMLKQEIPDMVPKKYNQLPLEYKLYLSDMDWSVGDNGKPKIKDKIIPTKSNVKTFFNTMDILFDDYTVSFDDKDYQHLLSFYQIRNSMMHPKDINELIISKEQLYNCEAAAVWVKNEFVKVTNAIIKHKKP